MKNNMGDEAMKRLDNLTDKLFEVPKEDDETDEDDDSDDTTEEEPEDDE